MSKKTKQFFLKTRQWWLIEFGLVAFYLLTHLWQLTSLPVFADESIYVRWSQLIIDDWHRYLFFPMNDGKTPLLMWLTVPSLLSFKNPLWAARFVAVLVGLFQMLSIGAIMHSLQSKTWSRRLAMILTATLPFWYFHHRVALTDGLMVLGISVAIWAAINLVHAAETARDHRQWRWVGILGLSIGLSLWSKLPALLFLPALPFFALLSRFQTKSERIILLIKLGLAAVVGLAVFGSLKIHPSFGQLFNRGSDFLYPLSEVIAGQWQVTIRNIPNYVSYFIAYVSLPLMLFLPFGLFSRHRQRQQWVMLVSAMAFFGPIALMGKVVYPRYFLPVMAPLTVMIALSIEEIVAIWGGLTRKLPIMLGSNLAVAILLSNALAFSGIFMYFAAQNPNQLPLVPADRVQYLTEWSSGHGITETVVLLQQLAQDESIAAATEGYFGTLPDGILMYLHNQDVTNLYVEGIGQPVQEIPDVFRERASQYDRQLLVVNSHRMLIELPPDQLVLEVCRPDNAPCLQVWDISEFFQN